MKDGVLGCVAVALVVVLGIVAIVGLTVLDYAGGFFHRVASPDAVTESFEWYEQQYRDIKAADGQLRDAEESLTAFEKKSGPSDKRNFFTQQEWDRLNSNVTGLKQSRRTLIENYNARAAMVTKNLWKNQNLPQHIEE